MDLSPYRRPKGRFAFHITARENAPSIRKDGLRQSVACNSDTETITEALVSHGYDNVIPFDRSEVVCCHLDADYPKEYGMYDWFGNDDIVVVLDLETVLAPLYLADMSAANECINHHVAPDPATVTDTFDEAVRKYCESIVRLDGTDPVPKQTSKVGGYPELIINGDVPREAIVDIRG